ncbi:MarR family winged helix-turn-helix transcriptional regulator [Flexivirga meconopsidis]|uniref:MarR family winged helix-turn-helix transcriptional regulator n=1 Tax=Flexivirga meconopsidis TaxID=2977121 RepID=UPI00224097AE|nr:MarR family transcriptional regulator [Flexivirga meconopsidis]
MPIDHDVAMELSTELIHMVKKVESLRAHSPRVHAGAEPSSYPLIFALTKGPARVSALAELIHSDVSTVSRQVTNLVSHGLVAKVSDPDDRRAQRVALTPAGESLVERLQVGRGMWFQTLLESWDNDEARDFAAHLRRFVDQLGAELGRLRAAGGELPEYPPIPDSRKDVS